MAFVGALISAILSTVDSALLAAFTSALSSSSTASSSLAALVGRTAPAADENVVTTTPAWTQQQDHALRADYSAVDAASVLSVQELSTSVFRPRGGQGRRGLVAVVVVLVLLVLVLAARVARAKPLSVSAMLGHASSTCST